MKILPKTTLNRLTALALATAFCFSGAIQAQATAYPPVRRTGVNTLDKTFAIEASHGLRRDAALALLAQHRAQSKTVREFAANIYDQRTRAHERLRRLAQETRLRLPERLDAHQRRQVEKLGSLAGREFDKQFLEDIAQSDYIRFFQFELNNGVRRVYPPVRAFAKEQMAILRNDMQRARKLLKDYR